jgi:hypothetical protein
VPEPVITAKPGLENYFGRQVILGIRPSDFEDAAWPRIAVTAGVTEGHGTEIHAIFTIDAPRRLHFFDPASGESIGHPLTADLKAEATA